MRQRKLLADNFTYDYDKDEMIKAICEEVTRRSKAV